VDKQEKSDLLWLLRDLPAQIGRLKKNLTNVGLTISTGYCDLILQSVREKIEEVENAEVE